MARALPGLCQRAERSDGVRDVFCASTAPRVESLADLDQALGMSVAANNGFGYAGVVLLAHSTALSGELVSELNPRAIIAGQGMFVAFSRGVQQVEIAALDRTHEPSQYNLYLLRFEQACNASAQGCGPGDLYTQRIESGWLRVALDDDEDLKNTPADCSGSSGLSTRISCTPLCLMS